MKLDIELVPSSMWYVNLRNAMGRENWDVLRRKVYRDWGYRCGVCGATGVTLNCHERWAFDDRKHVQKLLGFIALCPMCHHVKHIGMAGILADKGELSLGAVVDHFLRVNGCTMAEYKLERERAFRLFHERSKHPWKLDLGGFAGRPEDWLSELAFLGPANG